MTKALPFTQAGLQRAIRAAKAEGLRVVGIKPGDGTLIVEDGEKPPTLVPAAGETGQDATPSDEWRDVQA